MKPLKLTMNAFGSYGKETVIDFTKADHGLFLITGDTGAGKTTIFDGITFAIYGETSGGKRDGKMMRSQFAAPTDETFVELTFSYHGEIYTVRRSPEYMREKKRGSGLVKAAASVELTMPDGTAFRGKMKETDKKLCEIMGIDREQFTQIAMIAQGDFLRLLHAKSDERKKIFSTIFQTGLYRKVEEELWENRKNLKEKISGTEERLKAYVQGIQIPEGAEASELTDRIRNQDTADPAVIREVLEQFFVLDETNLNRIFGPLSETELQYHALLEKRGRAKSDNDILSSFEKARTELQSYEKQEEVFTVKNIQLEKAERAYRVQPFLDKRKMAERTLGETKQTEIKMVHLNEDLFAVLLHAAEAVIDPNRQKEFSQTMKHADVQEMMVWISEWRSEEKEMIAAGQRKQELDRRADRLNRTERECQKKAMVLEQKMELLTESREQYGRLQEQFFREQAGILAKEKLVSGCPCPVCGSLEHPNPARLSEHAVTEAEVRGAQEVWEKKQKECEMLSLELRGERAKLEEAKTQLELERRLLPENYEVRREHLKAVLDASGRFLDAKERLQRIQLERANAERLAQDTRYEYEENREKEGFANEEEYLEVMNQWKSRTQVEQEKKRSNAYFTELQEKRAAVQTLRQQSEGKVYTDMAAFDLEMKSLKEKKENLQEQKERCVRIQKNHEELLKTLEKEEKSYRTLLEEFLVYDTLWQAAGGRLKGKVRLDFETYVQRMYFEKILAAANKRFLIFTDGKMKLKSRPLEEMGMVGASGLELNVYVMGTGKERDVKTLSGGESFLASLALALGLSDVVQSQAGSVRLESMFVDEGFGSLDDSTRSQAMRVLNELAGDDRLVGIISHVDTLKDSIERKLVVTRGLQGSSAVWS
ncbi:MAG: SMC family ATPase [Lachnoclostridium sp.]|nr:SMC family ATPase [Lachnoclostridium sp.]